MENKEKAGVAFDPEVSELLLSVPPPNDVFNEYEFFMKGQIYLEKEVCFFLRYMEVPAPEKLSFASSIMAARKIGGYNKVWKALDAFRVVRNSYAHREDAPRRTKRGWIRFVNIVESVWGVKGADLFPIKNIRKKRRFRLYFAYFMIFESLRIISSRRLDPSPVDVFIDAYLAELRKRV